MARFGLGRARTAIKRFYPHSPHQRLHVTPADLASLGGQQASQHPRAGEGKLQMQFVNPPHQGQVGDRRRSRQVVHAAAADVQSCRLLADRQIVCTVDHRFALNSPALVSAPSKKLVTALRAPCWIETSWH
jgi:hypothetical protein